MTQFITYTGETHTYTHSSKRFLWIVVLSSYISNKLLSIRSKQVFKSLSLSHRNQKKTKLRVKNVLTVPIVLSMWQAHQVCAGFPFWGTTYSYKLMGVQFVPEMAILSGFYDFFNCVKYVQILHASKSLS